MVRMLKLTIMYQSHQVLDSLSTHSLLVPWHLQLTQTVNEVPENKQLKTTRLSSNIVDIQQCTPLLKNITEQTPPTKINSNSICDGQKDHVIEADSIHVPCGFTYMTTLNSSPIFSPSGQCIVDRQQCTVGSGHVDQ